MRVAISKCNFQLVHIDGFAQDSSNSIAEAMELL